MSSRTEIESSPACSADVSIRDTQRRVRFGAEYEATIYCEECTLFQRVRRECADAAIARQKAIDEAKDVLRRNCKRWPKGAQTVDQSFLPPALR